MLAPLLLLATIAVLAAGPSRATALPFQQLPVSVEGMSPWQIGLSRLDASRAVNTPTLVAVIDAQNPAAADASLGSRIIRRQDASRPVSGLPGTTDDHAMMVTATLAGTRLGSCPGCRVISLGVMRRSLWGAVSTDHETVAFAVRRATDMGARVINLSLGDTKPCSRALRAAITRALSRGVVVVAAAGNAPGLAMPLCPARLPGVVSVGALTLSSAGTRTTFADQTLRPTIWAQGEWVLGDLTADGAALWNSGSSFAAPQVSGAIAALIGAPGAKVPRTRAGGQRVIARLRDSARVLPDGRPLLDAAALLGAPSPAAFADSDGDILVDLRGAAAMRVCSDDREPFHVLAATTLSADGQGIRMRAPDGTSTVPTGGWQQVRSVTLPAGGLHALTTERLGPGRSLVIEGPQACPDA